VSETSVELRREADGELWAELLSTHDPAVREMLILRYVPLVHFVLNRLGISPAVGTEYEDLVSQGLTGLIDAVDRYDPSFGAQFATYATVRIRGQVLGALRSLDWLSRSARRRARQLQQSIDTLWHALNRAPTDEELAAHLQVSVPELRRALVESDRVVVSLDSAGSEGDEAVSLHELLADEDQVDPGEALDEQDLRARLATALRLLPQREQMVLSMYYNDELTMKEIGAVLDLSESRVCQLHARAVLSLRSALRSLEMPKPGTELEKAYDPSDR
jgi:RNA polymerase sigma factor FliA